MIVYRCFEELGSTDKGWRLNQLSNLIILIDPNIN